MKQYIADHTKEYEVFIDDTQWGEEQLKLFSEYFHEVNSSKDIVEHVIYSLSEFGIFKMVEGVGFIEVNGIYPLGVDEERKCKSIKVTVLDDYTKIF